MYCLNFLCYTEVPKSPIPESEENLDSLHSIESDTLTEDSDETSAQNSSPLLKQPCQRQHSDISSLSNNSCHSDEKEEHTDSETDEPKYTVAQLVSAFNKHQEVASKTSLEAIMTEKRINEVTFPTGPKALRLFIPDIDIKESTLVRRKTSYKPRKNWEELRKQNEKNEAVLQGLSAEFDHDEDEEEEEKVSKCEDQVDHAQNKEFKQGWSAFEIQDNHDTTIDKKYKQCVDGAKAQVQQQTEPKEKVANYIYSQDRVNLKDILQKDDTFETNPKENMENLRKRTCIAKILLNDTALNVDGDANNNGSCSSSKTEHLKSFNEEKAPTNNELVRCSSMSSESSCPTLSSQDISWEDVRGNRGSSMSLEKEDFRGRRGLNAWDPQHRETRSRSANNLNDKKVWGKVCTGTYTRAMQKFGGKSADKKSALTPSTEKTRRKSSPAMPQLLNSNSRA